MATLLGLKENLEVIRDACGTDTACSVSLVEYFSLYEVEVGYEVISSGTETADLLYPFSFVRGVQNIIDAVNRGYWTNDSPYI